jgi:hypothetical protein
LSVIAGGESLVSHAGGVVLVETVRRSGLSRQPTRRLGPWRLPRASHDPGKTAFLRRITRASHGRHDPSELGWVTN